MGVDKKSVRRSFSKAAPNYDAHAGLQQKIACSLADLADKHVGDVRVAIDLGSGTGYGVRLLASRFPEAMLIAVDIAAAMLQQSRKLAQPHRSYSLCADANSLPLKPESVDLVYSSSFVQWCDTPQQLFAQLAEILKPGGWLIFSTYGPQTLHELRESWASVDDFPHTLEFLSTAKLSALLKMDGFIVHDCRRRLETIYYESVAALLHNLKGLGAQNRHHGRRQGLTPASKLHRTIEHYQKHFAIQGLVPASYEILIFAARLPYRGRR